MLSVNDEAMKIVECILREPEKLNVAVSRLPNGTTVIDMGQQVPGSWLAGKYYTEITMGGLGEVTFESFELDGYRLPAVCVQTAHPLLAGWVSQKHADPIAGKGSQPILAGPAKAKLNPPDGSILFAGYHDESQYAVAPFQTSQPFSVETASWVADACQVDPRNLYVLVAPSQSLVGSIQIPARPIDNIMHRLHSLGFDIHQVVFAASKTPIAPLSSDELTAMGRINDSMLYGGQVLVYLAGDDAKIRPILPALPTRSSKEYGKLFKQIFLENDCDFHRIDLSVHSVALVQINNITSGSCFSAGAIDHDLLKKSFLAA